MKKLLIGGIVVLALLTTIMLWENVRHYFDNTVEAVQQEKEVELTLEALTTARAESWLKSPEALEYAKNQVRGDIIEELSKQ